MYEIEFKALIKNNKFYTLDGQTEIQSPYYVRYISDINSLNKKEIEYILNEHKKMKKTLEQVKELIFNEWK